MLIDEADFILGELYPKEGIVCVFVCMFQGGAYRIAQVKTLLNKKY